MKEQFRDLSPITDKTKGVCVASRGRHRRRRRHTLPVPALAGSAAVAVAVAGSLTAPAGANGSVGTVDVLALDAPSRPAVTDTADPFGQISDATDALEAVAAEASDTAHGAIRSAEVKKARKAAEARTAREAEERARLAAMFVSPLGSYRISATYGMAGWRWSRGYHTGLDLTAAYGSPIRAVHSGQVTFAGWDGAYGQKVIISHPDGTETWYAHLSTINVGLGPVTTGALIGAVGCSGNCSGPHLHLEVHSGGGTEQDPYAWLRSKGLSL
jgi:murein DD-endopeptidase MepM/ murein hydrolase activator NlpD